MFLKAFLAQSKTGATSAMSVRTARPALKMPASKRCSLDRFSSSSNGANVPGWLEMDWRDAIELANALAPAHMQRAGGSRSGITIDGR